MSGVLSLYSLTLSRMVIGLVFSISGIGKLSDLSAFERAIVNFQILPKGLARLSAYLFLMGELAVVMPMLLGGWFLKPGFLLAFFLLIVFCAALLSMLIRGIQTPCNCFGVSQKPVSLYDIVRNVGFIGCAFVGWESLPIVPTTQASLVELAFLGLMALAFVTLWSSLGEVAELLHTS